MKALKIAAIVALAYVGIVTAFESLNMNMGGFQVGFSPSTRTGSEFVDLTMISKNGKFIR